MKSTCKIILYLLCIIFLCYGCSKKASTEKYYVVYSPYSYAANLLISNNRGLIREEANDISLEIIEDEMTKERVLLKSSTTIPITPVGGYWKWEPNTVTMKSKYKYFDFNTFEEYKIDDNYRIDSVFNGYAIIPTFELKNEEKERLIKELDESGSAYTRDIDLFDAYESNYYKTYEKVYNLKDNTFKKLAKTLTSIEIKNNEVIGIFRDNNYKDTYYHFDNDFNFIKELALPEYEKLKKDVDDQYDNVRFEFNTIDCGICKSVIDNGYCFVVDGKNRQITKKYNCKFLSAKNRTNDEQSIEDLIFGRDENDQYIYFNIKLSDDGTYKEKVIYKGDENGIVIGKNNCYAIIVGNEATIYNSRTDAPFGKVDYMVKNTNCEDGFLSNSLPGNSDYSNNEDMYLRDFILLDNFVYGKYVPKEYLNLFFEKKFLPFTLIGKDFSHDYVTLNTHSDTTILHGQYSILRNRNIGKTYLLDNKSLKLTEFDDNYKNMEKLSIGDRVFYELKKRDYIHSDLYDEHFNLIDTNLTHVKKYKNYIFYQKDSWTYVIDKNIKKVFSIGSTDSDIEFFW